MLPRESTRVCVRERGLNFQARAPLDDVKSRKAREEAAAIVRESEVGDGASHADAHAIDDLSQMLLRYSFRATLLCTEGATRLPMITRWLLMGFSHGGSDVEVRSPGRGG